MADIEPLSFVSFQFQDTILDLKATKVMDEGYSKASA